MPHSEEHGIISPVLIGDLPGDEWPWEGATKVTPRSQGLPVMQDYQSFVSLLFLWVIIGVKIAKIAMNVILGSNNFRNWERLHWENCLFD